MGALTKQQIREVFDRVRNWPVSRQEDAAQVLMAMESIGTDVYRLSGDERADIEAALEEVVRGEVAPDTDVAALFSRARR